jgi:hypothetical protein
MKPIHKNQTNIAESENINLEDINTKQFIEELEQTEKDLAMGDYIEVDSLEEVFGK